MLYQTDCTHITSLSSQTSPSKQRKVWKFCKIFERLSAPAQLIFTSPQPTIWRIDTLIDNIIVSIVTGAQEPIYHHIKVHQDVGTTHLKHCILNGLAYNSLTCLYFSDLITSSTDTLPCNCIMTYSCACSLAVVIHREQCLPWRPSKAVFIYQKKKHQ
mgnify:CR=1 FL=1